VGQFAWRAGNTARSRLSGGLQRRQLSYRADKLTYYQDLSTEQLGDWWIDSRTSAVQQVPSFVIAGEHNFLLNPVHSEFARIQVEPPAIFHFDERLFEES
jgi:RES domain-containing protein